MSAIHYKFSSSNEYKNITFDGITISLLDLKRAIMEKQKLKSTELDLHITNAQTLQVYKDESALIPKNTAVLVRRIPLGPVRDSKVYIVKRHDNSSQAIHTSTKVVQEPEAQPKLSFDELTKASNLAEANASEEDKIKAAIHQSTNEYDPSNFYRPPKYGSYKYNASSTNTPSTAATPSYVRCYRCNQHGHYSMHCPLPKTEVDKVKTMRLATGIPRSHMVEVNKESKGAMLTSDGRYVVPVMDKKGYDIGKKERPPFIPETVKPVEEEEEDEPIPDELICLLCKDLLVDAVVIPCCGNSYCDDCIRNALLDSETHQCPTCHKENISPDSLIANKFLRQAVNKFKNDTGIAKKKSNAPVWPRPAPSDKPKTKPTSVPTTKVSYGPPQSRTESRLPGHLGAYVVKAKTEQIVSRPYTVAKRQMEGGSSPHDPTQPIRIKLAPNENNSDNVKTETTPGMAEPNAQSTPIDAQALPSTTPQSDSYTFNSTPDTGEEKPKPVPVEPLPPGISPPTAKVVRSLIENAIKSEPSVTTPSLTGIHPLAQSHPPKSSSPVLPPTAVSESYMPEDNSLSNSSSQHEPEIPAACSSIASNITSVGQDLPVHTALTPNENFADSQSPGQSAVTSQPPAVVEKPVQVNPPNSKGLGLMGTAPPSALSTIALTDSKRPAANVSPALQPPVNRPPPPQPQPILSKPPSVPMTLPPPPMIPPVLPPGLANIPPPSIPTSGVNIFQHPPPPFPFNLLLPPPTSQPPPGFPPGLSIPSLGSAPPPSLPLPPGTESKPIGFPSVSSSSRQPDRQSRLPPDRHARSPMKKRSSTRSPKRRQDRGRKSKLDIMSDEFAEKMSKKRVSDKKRGRRRSRSRSVSVSSGSSYSSSSYSSSSRSSSSYSSYTGSSWSSSSFSESISRSPSPRHRRKNKAKKVRGRRRSKSWSSPVKTKSKSRRRRSTTPKRNDSRRRRRSISKEKKRSRSSFTPPPTRRDRRRSPRRGARDRSRTPPMQPNMRPSRRDVPGQSYPAIPVISTNQSQPIPGLPSKEQADYERDQALYAHYRQAYERDWYERGIMPPPPYNRFIQPRFSRSPSPPGTGTRILPPPGTEAIVSDAWNAQNRLITPSGLPASELYELQSNILREEQYYDDVQARLRAMAGGYVEQPPTDAQDDRRRRAPRRRYDEDRSAPSGRQRDGRRGSRDRYSGSRYSDDRRGGRRDRDDVRDTKHRGLESKSRRENDSSTLVEGDATPVRDERPPPSVEEEIVKKAEEKVVPRRAGDNVKMGKVSTLRRNRSDKHTGSSQAEKSGSRPESKNRSQKEPDLNTKDGRTESRSSKPDSRRNDRKSDSRRSDQRKVEAKEKVRDSHTERTETKKSHPARTDSQPRKSHRHSPSERSDKSKEKKEQSVRDDKKSERDLSRKKREVRITERFSSPKDEAAKKQKEKVRSPQRGSKTANVSVPKSEPGEEAKVQETKTPTNIVKADTPETNLQDGMIETPKVENNISSAPSQNSPKDSDENVDTMKLWKPVTEVAIEQNPFETQEETKFAVATHSNEAENGDDERPPSENADILKVVPESECKPNIETAPSPKSVTTENQTIEVKKEVLPNNEATAKGKRDKSSKRKGEKKHKKSESSKRKKRADAAEKKNAEKLKLEEKNKAVIEYDGSAPPPTGDELIKITIPKSRWEESDEESKLDGKPQNNDQKEEVKPASKGRRIKIKRKPPVETVAGETKTTSDDKSPARKVKEKSDAEAKKPAQNEAFSTENHDTASNSDKVVDARMVITLRRNSKREEDARPRRVSLEGPTDDDYRESKTHEDASSKDKSVIALKGKSIKVTAMRSSRRESEDFINDDVLDLSHPSGLSDFGSESEQVEQKKAAKKKKKKKKKHKNRRPTTDEQADTASDRRPTKESDEATPEPKRKFVIKNEFYSDNEEYEDDSRKSRSGRKMERKESKRTNTAKRHHDSSRDQSQRRERKRYRRERLETESDNESDRERERTKRDERREGRHKHDKRHKRRHRRRRDYESAASSYDDEVDYKRSRRSVS